MGHLPIQTLAPINIQVKLLLPVSGQSKERNYSALPWVPQAENELADFSPAPSSFSRTFLFLRSDATSDNSRNWELSPWCYSERESARFWKNKSTRHGTDHNFQLRPAKPRVVSHHQTWNCFWIAIHCGYNIPRFDEVSEFIPKQKVLRKKCRNSFIWFFNEQFWVQQLRCGFMPLN